MEIGKVRSSEELFKCLYKMNRENSVLKFEVPDKGEFTLVLQEDYAQTIQNDVSNNPILKQMLKESEEQYRKGNTETTSEFIKQFSNKDFK